ncbi:MAG: isoprenylcysteine carboxylmethyltransferase family protein [Acidobacteria bacterium]|nr:isoprenylcysteine carboxylmethyltransferase family protein [Acidobacteriota bacterium]
MEATIDDRSMIQRMRVPLGFLTAVLFVLGARPTWLSLACGAPLALLGAMIRGWASGHLRKNAELATSGPYAHTRNPLYFGSFVMVAGFAVAGGNKWVALWLVWLFLMIYRPVMRAEVAHIRQLFGAAYDEWAQHVPLFFPRLTPYRGGDVRAFDWSQYLHHREYRAFIGVLAVVGLLALKIVWK